MHLQQGCAGLIEVYSESQTTREEDGFKINKEQSTSFVSVVERNKRKKPDNRNELSENGKKNDKAEQIGDKKTSKIRYPCELCDKVYLSVFGLYRHGRTHTDTDERPFKCQLCDNSYVNFLFRN